MREGSRFVEAAHIGNSCYAYAMAYAMQLRGRDAATALAFAGEVAACRDPAQLRAQFDELPRLIGADGVLVSACHDWANDLVMEAGDVRVYRPELLDVARRAWRDHPVLAHDLARPARGTTRLSDFVRARDWRRRTLFNDFYQPLGMTGEISTQLYWGPPGASCCITLHRTGRDFSERDIATLEALAPHLRAARARVAAEARAQRLLGLLEACGAPLSAPLPTPSPTPPGAPLSASPAPLPAPLLAARLPVTRREAEVLAELATGATNDGIAYRLRISRHTVVRHVEHIYAKLEVHTRAAATRAALDALGEDR